MIDADKLAAAAYVHIDAADALLDESRIPPVERARIHTGLAQAMLTYALYGTLRAIRDDIDRIERNTSGTSNSLDMLANYVSNLYSAAERAASGIYRAADNIDSLGR